MLSSCWISISQEWLIRSSVMLWVLVNLQVFLFSKHKSETSMAFTRMQKRDQKKLGIGKICLKWYGNTVTEKLRTTPPPSLLPNVTVVTVILLI